MTTTAATLVGGGGVLKEEPVQFPVTFHTSAAYCVTKIKLYATFSMYFRVHCSFKLIIPLNFLLQKKKIKKYYLENY